MTAEALIDFIPKLIEGQIIWVVIAIVCIIYLKNRFEISIEDAKKEIKQLRSEHRDELKKEREEAKAEREKSYEVLSGFTKAFDRLTNRVDGVESGLKEVVDKLDRIV